VESWHKRIEAEINAASANAQLAGAAKPAS